jgi:hypothetical protein
MEKDLCTVRLGQVAQRNSLARGKSKETLVDIPSGPQRRIREGTG